MSRKITVYSRPDNVCYQCKMTKSKLTSLGIPFDVIMIENDPAALSYIKNDLGYVAAPVVTVEKVDELGNRTMIDHWYGLNPNKINNLVTNLVDTDEL